MKKQSFLVIIILSIIMFLLSPSIRGQTASYNGANSVIIFSGISAQRLNLNTYSYYYGAYLDYIPVKSITGYSLGFFATANHSYYLENLQSFSGSGWQMAAGLSLGRYREGISRRASMFIGLNIGLMYALTKGKSSNVDFHNQQKTYLLFSSLNLNILRTGKSFPRTQLLITAEPQLRAREILWFKGESKIGKVWSMSYYQVLFKQSLVDIGFKSWDLSPKLLAFYNYSVGSSQGHPGLGGAISLHRKYKDDFLSCYYLYQFDHYRKDTFTIGIILNFSNFK